MRQGITLTCSPGVFSLCQLIHGQNASLLRRLFHKGLNKSSPLLRFPPIQKYDIAASGSSRRRGVSGTVTFAGAEELCAAVLAHEVEDLADVGRRQAPIDAAVEEEVGLCGGGDCYAEEAVVAGVGEDEGGPFCELGVVDGDVCLAGEEGGEEVFAGEGE